MFLFHFSDERYCLCFDQVYSRGVQYSDNDAAQYCAPWWWDQVTNTKINNTFICYEISVKDIDQYTGLGCAHRAPFEGIALGANITTFAPPDAALAPSADTLPVNATADANTTASASAPTTITTAASPITTAPATVAPPPIASPAPLGAAPAPLARRRLLDSNATTETTASAPTDAATTTTTANPAAISTREDFIKSGIYDPRGLELYDTRTRWYQCHTSTLPGTVSRETCYREAFGMNFGINAVVLRSMLRVMQVSSRSLIRRARAKLVL
jgi:hypothetical protein